MEGHGAAANLHACNSNQYNSPQILTITLKDVADGIPRLTVVCNPGDLLLINTRLWWHQTELPSTHAATEHLSVSYARDFFFRRDDALACQQNMTNVDGLYAAKSIRKGGIVLTEHELPDCSLPRSETPNCEVLCFLLGLEL